MQIKGLIWSGSNFVIVGSGGKVKTSVNGETWTNGTYLSGSSVSINDIIKVGTDLYAVDYQGKIAKSSDHGANWTESDTIPSTSINNLVHHNTTFYAFLQHGSFNEMWKSENDAASWSRVNSVPL